MKKKSIMKKIVSFLLVFCMVVGIAFSNVGTREVQADTSVADGGKTTLRPLTFADFGITDGTYEGGFYAYPLQTVDSTKVSSLTLVNSKFSGYMQLDNAGRTTSVMPCLTIGHTGTSGLRVQFYPHNETSDRIYITTSPMTDINKEDFLYVFEEGLFDSKFKIELSFETMDSDGDNVEDDLAFRLYINDELCTAINSASLANTALSTGETVGEYYICDYKADAFRPYINMSNMSSTNETMYKSVTIESCELPYTSTTTFTNYGLDNQVFSGSSIGGTVTNTMEYTKFVGDVTLGGAGTAMINYGATAANNVNHGGLQLQITADTGAFWIITGTKLGGKYLNESDATIDNIMYYASGLPVQTSFRLSFNTVPWDWDGDGTATDGKIEVRVNGKLLKDKYIFVENMFSDTDEVTLVNRIGVLAGGNFTNSTSTITIASVVETPDEGEDEEETVVDKRILTFADFGIADGTYTGGFSGSLATVDSTKLSSLTLADSEFSGYITLNTGGRDVTNLAYMILGGTAWAGVQVTFNTTNNRMAVSTTSITSVNGEGFQYQCDDGLFESKFKLTIALESVDADGDTKKNDLLLKVYINDELCTAYETGAFILKPEKTLSGTSGHYYVRDYSSTYFLPYMNTRQISSSDTTMYESITVESCDLPYINTSTFVDYGISDGLYDRGIKSGTSPYALEYTKLSGDITVGGAGSCIINYGGTPTSEGTAWPGPQLGGLNIQISPEKTAFWIMVGTRLGSKYLNETDGATEGYNTQYYASGFPTGKKVEISFNTIPWDWDGDGVATDGKIEVLTDGTLLKNQYIIIEGMFLDTVELVNRFSFITGGHTGTTATFDVESKAQDISRLRKLELADFGLANGEYVEQVHKSKGPDTLVNTMMEVDISVEESKSGSQIHYAVPLEKGGWYGSNFNILGDTITVGNASGSITGGKIYASEIERDTFFGEAFKLGLSMEKIDLQGDGNNDDARLGVWMEGKLLRNYYYIDNADEVGTGMSIFAYLTTEETYQNTVTVSDVTETDSAFTTKLGLEDVNASGVTPGVYGYSENPETKTLNPANQGAKEGDLDNAIFSTNVRFSKEHTKLFYGCPTDSGKGWYGIWIGPDGNEKETFTANYAGSYSLLDIDEKVVPDPTMHAGVAGVQLVNNTYKLGISTRYVDSDGDDLFDDLEVGLWFNDVLYNNTYCYINSEKLVSELKPNIAVHAANSDGYVVLGNYTQETATPVTHCADEFAYFVDGTEVTVAGESKGTSWSTNTPGEYAVTYTNTTSMGTSTFKENVLIYKTNDVTADGIVSAVDLVAMKRLAAGLRNDTTAAGKKAIGYAEDTNWYTVEVLNTMYAKLLADKNTIGAKVMSEEILGETGSATPNGTSTYITSLGATKEGTSVIGISDVADEAARTYVTDIEAFDGSGLDFVLDFDTDREIKVLQITDTQIIDAGQCRTDNRLSANEKAMWATDQLDNQLFDELKALVAKEKPDLIVMTGDNVYGEFDDSGAMSTKLVQLMDGFKIPWAPIFGNHDNELKLGVSWQCQQFMESDYCIFNRRNEIGGNGNYSIGISVQGNLQRTIFMMDTNGCSNLSGVEKQEDKDAVTINFVFHDEQLAWYRTTAEKVNQHTNAKIPSFLCVHVPLAEVAAALVETGYQAKADANVNGTKISHNYTVGNIIKDDTAWTYEKDAKANFGFKESGTIGASIMSEFILPHMKAAGTDGTFFGHQHKNGISVEWEGIRFTYGLKTGFYDENPNQTGGTVIKLNGSEFDVNHTIINNLDAE